MTAVAKFVMLSEATKDLASKHMRKAGWYAARGNFACADGSAEKASRKFLKAQELKLEPANQFERELLERIEAAIILGLPIVA